MNWRDDGSYFTCERFPDVRCYKSFGGRPMTRAEYELVLTGTSPLFSFISSKRKGETFQAQLYLDKTVLRYKYPPPARSAPFVPARPAAHAAPKSAPRPSHRPGPIASLPAPDLKPTPTIQEEIGWLRGCLQTPGLHNLPMVLVPYRMVAPNNPTATVKEEPKLVPVGLLELSVAEELTTEKAQQIALFVQPRVRALLDIATKLQTKAYVIVMSPTNAHFWVYNLTDRGQWDKKTTQTMPGFLSQLRRHGPADSSPN